MKKSIWIVLITALLMLLLAACYYLWQSLEEQKQANVELQELADIEGFDEDVATELQNRAKDFVAKRNDEFTKKSKKLKIDESLQTVEGLDQDMIIKLAENKVKNIDDLADLAADELVEILGEDTISAQEANEIIMKAREHWFAEEDKSK